MATIISSCGLTTTTTASAGESRLRLLPPSPPHSSSIISPSTMNNYPQQQQRMMRKMRTLRIGNSRMSEIVMRSSVAVEKTTSTIPELRQQQPLIMFFQAEGTMNEAGIRRLTNALEGAEGIGDLKVQVVEGIASVELTKETTMQATGVASNLVEIIQGSGFTLQTLNLSFEDEQGIN